MHGIAGSESFVVICQNLHAGLNHHLSLVPHGFRLFLVWQEGSHLKLINQEGPN